jgi:glycosyltransferase involved in cell wall biosynthesis
MLNKFAHITGGADRHCLDLAKALRKARHEVSFLSTLSPSNLESSGVFLPATVTHRTRDELSSLEALAVARRALWNPEAAEATESLLASFKPDIVHAHKLYPQLSVAPVVVAARRRVPVVQTIHDYEFVSASAFDAEGDWIDRDESRLSYRMLNTATYPVRRGPHARRVDAWVTVSRAAARVHEARGIASTVLPNFVAQGSMPALTHAERRGIVFAGRLTPEKGTMDVLEVARRLPNVNITIAGTGRLSPVVRRASAELDNLQFLGHIPGDELSALVARARAVLMPSRWQEPGPLGALEAMRSGTPIIAYPNGGLAEYILDAGAGVIRSDVRGLENACRDLDSDADLWNTLSRGGLRAVLRTHSENGYVSRLVEFYERAVAQGR